jgi:hypothetical protein
VTLASTRNAGLSALICFIYVDDIIGKDASLYKLSCEFGVLNACYDMGDIELLTPKVETSHCKKRRNFSA